MLPDMSESRGKLSEALFLEASTQASEGVQALDFMRELYPICRSITGDGLRRTLQMIGDRIPLQISEVPSGSTVFDWQVPKEWNVREAYLVDPNGRRVLDFRENNLHLVNYSCPVRRRMSLEELRPHLHTRPDRPDWIPYRTSYYRENWGFCLTQRQLEQLIPGEYEVVIESSLDEAGSLSYAQCVLPGDTDREFLLFTHCCHPSTCNDNLTGIAIATALARWLGNRTHRYTFRFVFAPATIGSITWLAGHEPHLHRIEHGLVLGLLGDGAPLSYKPSRRETCITDRIGAYVMQRMGIDGRLREFGPYGYDERQFCSPGFDLPVGRLTRSSNGEYDQYHTSADNMDIVSAGALAGSFWAALQFLAIADTNQVFINRSPKCEPRLGKYGLYSATGGTGPDAFEQALLWLLNQADGSKDLLQIAVRAGIPFALVWRAAEALERAGLLRPA